MDALVIKKDPETFVRRILEYYEIEKVSRPTTVEPWYNTDVYKRQLQHNANKTDQIWWHKDRKNGT